MVFTRLILTRPSSVSSSDPHSESLATNLQNRMSKDLEKPFLRSDPCSSTAKPAPQTHLRFAVVGILFGIVLGVFSQTLVSGGQSAAVDFKAKKKEPFKILFVGNSFTYGPPPSTRPDQLALNNLPRFFKLVAESLGHPVLQQEDTLGGCSLYAAHRPSIHPESKNCSDPATSPPCKVVHTGCLPSDPDCTPRLTRSEACTVARDILVKPTYHPCPQFFERQQYGSWDVVVMQDQSELPTVKRARELYLYPAVEEYANAAKHQSDGIHKKPPIVAAYMTWPYYNGSMYRCPGASKEGCFPHGDLEELSECKQNDHWSRATKGDACQAYALARGYASLLSHGADVVVPVGLTNLAARGRETIPDDCKAAVDSEYEDAGPLASLDLPLKVDPDDIHWRGDMAHNLFRDLGKIMRNADGTPAYCTDNCTHDHHPSVIGMYLSALVFFTTLFKESPVGAAWPNGQTIDGMKMPVADPEWAKAAQRIARDAVLPHLSVWWNGK